MLTILKGFAFGVAVGVGVMYVRGEIKFERTEGGFRVYKVKKDANQTA